MRDCVSCKVELLHDVIQNQPIRSCSKHGTTDNTYPQPRPQGRKRNINHIAGRKKRGHLCNHRMRSRQAHILDYIEVSQA